MTPSSLARGVVFREAMSGRIRFGQSDPLAGSRDECGVAMVLHGAIRICDLDEFIADPMHTGEMTGYLDSPRLGGVLPASRAVFRLFSPGSDPAVREMVYEMGFSRDGRSYWLAGKKIVRIGLPFRLWHDTTTLFVTLHEGSDRNGAIVAAGILSLGVPGLLRLALTFKATGCSGLMQKLGAVFRFAAFFTGELWRTYVLRRQVMRTA